MKLILQSMLIFIIGSVIGWIIESIYRSITTKQKINPGFLNGPYLPIYGTGFAMLNLLITIINPLLNFHRLLIYLIVTIILLTFFELIGGIIFIKGLKLKLWDYSHQWLNYQGIICPLFSLIWGIGGLTYLYLGYPWINPLTSYLSDFNLVNLLIGIFYGVMLIDIIFSLMVTFDIVKIIKPQKLVINYELLKNNYQLLIKKQQYQTKYFHFFKHRNTLIISFKEAISISTVNHKK